MIVEVDYTHRIYGRFEIPDCFMRKSFEDIQDFIVEHGEEELKPVHIYENEFQFEWLTKGE